MTTAPSTEFLALNSQRIASLSGSFSSETPVCVAFARWSGQSPANTGAGSTQRIRETSRRVDMIDSGGSCKLDALAPGTIRFVVTNPTHAKPQRREEDNSSLRLCDFA